MFKHTYHYSNCNINNGFTKKMSQFVDFCIVIGETETAVYTPLTKCCIFNTEMENVNSLKSM